MENSSTEAIFIGVFVFIFIIAISVSILLFRTVNQYADLSYDYGKTVTDTSIVENVPKEKYKLITGSEVVSYYYNYIKQDMYGEQKRNLNYVVQISPNEAGTNLLRNNLTYNQLIASIKPTTQYVLTYQKVLNGKTYISIRKAKTDEIKAVV